MESVHHAPSKITLGRSNAMPFGRDEFCRGQDGPIELKSTATKPKPPFTPDEQAPTAHTHPIIPSNRPSDFGGGARRQSIDQMAAPPPPSNTTTTSAAAMEIGDPEHAFWQGCRRLLAVLQPPTAPATAAAAATITTAATALAQAVAGGRQEAASEALATLLLEGSDGLSRRVEREFRSGAWGWGGGVLGWDGGLNRDGVSCIDRYRPPFSHIHTQKKHFLLATVLVDLVARLLHRSIATDADNNTPAAAAGVVKHMALFARLLPGTPHVKPLVWEVSVVGMGLGRL
jgi:hypothetical protein